jgi:hypothetical protein
MLDAQQYLGDAPPGFIDSADVILLLKDEERALVHSHFLAYHSTVLNALLCHLTKEGRKEGMVTPFRPSTARLRAQPTGAPARQAYRGR